MEERFDIAIIGSGPAGLSAAINAKIRNKRIIIFGNKNFSNKLIKAPKIDNYLGFYHVSGKELKEKFKEHIEQFGIEVVNERINNVYAMGDYFALMVNEKMYEATAVILATGMETVRLLKGEEEFLGKGVGYCATCDAPLYKGRTIAIVGYNQEAEEEANYVNELAGKLYYIPMYKKELKLHKDIEIIQDIRVEVTGDSHVSSLILKNGELEVDAVFLLKDSISPSQLVPGLTIEEEHIKVDRSMSTNLEGCFAAGDCTGKPYQYMKAAGEGLIAGQSAAAYVDKLRRP